MDLGILILTFIKSVGASFFISYSYYKNIDRTHSNWEQTATKEKRISTIDNHTEYHKEWILQIVSMNESQLDKKKLGLSGSKIIVNDRIEM